MKYGIGFVGGGDVTHYLWGNGAAYCGSGNCSTGVRRRSRNVDLPIRHELPTCQKCLRIHDLEQENDLPEPNQVMRLYNADDFLVYVTEVNDHSWLVKYTDQYGTEEATFPSRLSMPTIHDKPVWTWVQREDRTYDIFWKIADNPKMVRNQGYITYRVPKDLRDDLNTVRRLQRALIRGLNT